MASILHGIESKVGSYFDPKAIGGKVKSATSSALTASCDAFVNDLLVPQIEKNCNSKCTSDTVTCKIEKAVCPVLIKQAKETCSNEVMSATIGAISDAAGSNATSYVASSESWIKSYI